MLGVRLGVAPLEMEAVDVGELERERVSVTAAESVEVCDDARLPDAVKVGAGDPEPLTVAVPVGKADAEAVMLVVSLTVGDTDGVAEDDAVGVDDAVGLPVAVAVGDGVDVVVAVAVTVSVLLLEVVADAVGDEVALHVLPNREVMVLAPLKAVDVVF